jgi:nitronate monooxygenase
MAGSRPDLIRSPPSRIGQTRAMWPDRRVLDLLRIEQPILQAPMAGSASSALAIAVASAGGLGSLACALLRHETARNEIAAFRSATARPLNLNFFCHTPPVPDGDRERAWRHRLAPYYAEHGIDPDAPIAAAARAPFDATWLGLVDDLRPEVVSFHFGLPEPVLLAAVKATGAVVLSTATTVAEARWLEARGCDAIIAQGAEAGGHRGMFLTADAATQVGTFALVRQIALAVRVPVIAAGGIGDARAIAAALTLGASAVQLGTAFLLCPEASTSAVHRAAVRAAVDNDTVITNVLTGRPARGIVNRAIRDLGPMSGHAPAFPLAAGALGPLRAAAESAGSGDFSPMWAGQAVAQCRDISARDLVLELAADAVALVRWRTQA